MTIIGIAGTIIDPSHHEFNEARFSWNGMIDRKPAPQITIGCAR
jgi:hypothetical protein